MINCEELREFVRDLIRDELKVHVEYSPETHSDHAKIRVSLSLKGIGWHPDEEISYTEDRIYGN